MSKKDSRVGVRVQLTAKHLAGKEGKVSRLDRGNVWVKLDSGEEVCTRWAKCQEITEAPFYE